MGSPGHLLILLLLLLILIQDHKRLLVLGYMGKLGRCPRVATPCDYLEPRECYRDGNCKGPMKCCLHSCGMKCLDPKEDPCKLPVKGTPCSHSVTRWYYDRSKNDCFPFKSNQCIKSKNNFQSHDVCSTTCMVIGQQIVPPKRG